MWGLVGAEQQSVSEVENVADALQHSPTLVMQTASDVAVRVQLYH